MVAKLNIDENNTATKKTVTDCPMGGNNKYIYPPTVKRKSLETC